jgi:hypothetical protein
VPPDNIRFNQIQKTFIKNRVIHFQCVKANEDSIWDQCYELSLFSGDFRLFSAGKTFKNLSYDPLFAKKTTVF